MTRCDTAPGPLLVDSTEAARLLSIGRRKLWEIYTVGDLPCVRIGKAVRFRPADLAAWVDSQCNGSATK